MQANWIEQLANKDKRTIARLISQIENNGPMKDEISRSLHPLTGHAHVIGFTGPPGAGKSTLISALIREIRDQGLSVAIIAVDPTSPFTGGAVLGDRIRMLEHAVDEGVFIRSMGSRGSLGGLAKCTREVIRVFDAAKFDFILLETVGVGQAELEVMHLADTVALVLHPTAGDIVQVFKAGIMEIADLFVVNKADFPEARRLVSNLHDLIHLRMGKMEWIPTVVETISTERKGISNLLEEVKRHKTYLDSSGEGKQRVKERIAHEIFHKMTDAMMGILSQAKLESEFEQMIQDVVDQKKTPDQVAEQWVKQLLGGNRHH